MHFLTKALVVLASILAIAVSTLTTAYALNADRIANDWATLKAKADFAEGLASSAGEAAEAQVQLVESRLGEANARVSELESQLSTASGRAQSLEAELARKESELTFAMAQYGSEKTAVEAMAAVIAQLQRENGALHDQALALRDESINQRDEISDLRSLTQVQEQTRRALEEQLVEAQRELERLRSGGTTMAGGEGSVARDIPGPAVVGTVSEVLYEESTGKTLVYANLGTNDRVTPDAQLYVIRGDQYIGKVRVTQADLNMSEAVVITTNSQVAGAQVRAGDTITSKISG